MKTQNVFIVFIGQCNLPLFGTGPFCTLHSNQRQCVSCGRRLRDGLFVENSHTCNACTKRKSYVDMHKQTGGSRFRTATNDVFIEYDIPGDGAIDPLVFLNSMSSEIHHALVSALEINRSVRWNIS